MVFAKFHKCQLAKNLNRNNMKNSKLLLILTMLCNVVLATNSGAL